MVGIGECGLDYYYDLSPRDGVQSGPCFRPIFDAAGRPGLPLMVTPAMRTRTMIRILEERLRRTGPFQVSSTALLHQRRRAPPGRAAATSEPFFSVSGITAFKAAEDGEGGDRPTC